VVQSALWEPEPDESKGSSPVLRGQGRGNPPELPDKDRKTSGQFATKRQKRINQIMNSQRTKQHICKPHKPTQNQSLQKSCFLANAR